MAETIPNLWPTEFKVDVQTPLTILRVQANLLSKVTKGILNATVESEEGKDQVQHRLVVISPAYNSYRHTLITAIHNRNLPYPVEVREESLAELVAEDNPVLPAFGRTYRTVYPKANSDDQMQRIVHKALQSEPTKAVILSLIAKSNEADQSPKKNSEGESNPDSPAQ